jgi:ribonuclease HII
MIAGTDEAGRGPLAGPVVAGAVILDPNNPIDGLTDSKKLTEKKRLFLEQQIKEKASAWSVGIVHEQDIDRINILQASLKAMHIAIHSLKKKPDFVQVDGNKLIPELGIDQKAIVGGDLSEQAISAASIIAKTARDGMMQNYHVLFPLYGFDKHKGYGTKQHFDAIKEHGASPIHRNSFNPVSDFPNKKFCLKKNHGNIGVMGELFAGMYFVRNGYEILEKNLHVSNNGEIDLLVKKDALYVVVEVKSGFNVSLDDAVSRVDEYKQKQLGYISGQYFTNNEIVPFDVRFDIVVVQFSSSKPTLTHLEEAFLPI